MHFIGDDHSRAWAQETGELERIVHSLGREAVSSSYLSEALGLPPHLELVVRAMLEEHSGEYLDALASIPFFSLCFGLFLPLSGMAPGKVAAVFGFQWEGALAARDREELLQRFLGADLGQSLVQKLSCLLGDPFRGRPGTMRRDSLVKGCCPQPRA